MPDDGQVPYMGRLTHRLYHRLPEVHRTMDARGDTWVLKRYLGGVLGMADEIDETIDSFAGDNPVGPSSPIPWGLRPDELQQWQAARLSRPAALGDPDQADPSWLPWLAQLVGARLDPAADLEEHRDTIRYATSGWRGGTRAAIADAARTALTGERYALVVPHTRPGNEGGLTDGSVWDITIVTRESETPDPNAVIGAILRKGAKPAGAVLWHSVYQSTWERIEAIYPTWQHWEAATWDSIEESGLRYRNPAGNLVPNPSFEVDTTGWLPRDGAALSRVSGGVDGVGMGRATMTEEGAVESPTAPVDSSTEYSASISVWSSVAINVAMALMWSTSGVESGEGVVLFEEEIPEQTWIRITGVAVPPEGADGARIAVVTGVAGVVDIDAAYIGRV